MAEEAFLNQLNDAKAWRTHELDLTMKQIRAAWRKPALLHVLVRAGLLLLYAHYEGFATEAFRLYLQYVAQGGRRSIADLSPRLRATTLLRRLQQVARSGDEVALLDLIETLLVGPDGRVPRALPRTVASGSNLAYSVLRRHLALLGLDPTPYATKQHFIDDVLLHHRNRIAHGAETDVDAERYLDIHEQVAVLLDSLYTQVDAAVANKSYLSVPVLSGWSCLSS